MSVSLRAAQPGDYARVRAWIERPEIHRWLDAPFAGGALREAQYQLLIARPAQARVFVFERDARALGVVGLGALDPRQRSGELWYWLGATELRGTGVTTAACALALDVAFGELGLEAVRACVVEGNDASRRVLAKLGFREAGRWRAAFATPDEGDRDRLWFDLLASEWRAEEHR